MPAHRHETLGGRFGGRKPSDQLVEQAEFSLFVMQQPGLGI